MSPETITGIAIAMGVGSIFMACLARIEARVAKKLAEDLGHKLIELSHMIDDTDEALSKSIADVRRRVEAIS